MDIVAVLLFSLATLMLFISIFLPKFTLFFLNPKTCRTRIFAFSFYFGLIVLSFALVPSSNKGSEIIYFFLFIASFFFLMAFLNYRRNLKKASVNVTLDIHGKSTVMDLYNLSLNVKTTPRKPFFI